MEFIRCCVLVAVLISFQDLNVVFTAIKHNDKVYDFEPINGTNLQ